MHLGLGSRLLVSAAIFAAATCFTYITFHPRGFPRISLEQKDNYTFLIHTAANSPLPSNLSDGDEIDLRKQRFEVRAALVLPVLPIGYTIRLTVTRGVHEVDLPASVADLRNVGDGTQSVVTWQQWLGLVADWTICAVALLLLWRGRDRAAFGMAFWAVTYVLSVGANYTPLAGSLGLALFFAGIVLFLSARVGFYVMIAATLKNALTPTMRRVFRFVFIFLLVVGAIQAFGSQIIRLITGSMQFAQPQYGLLLSSSYLVPALMLVAGYQRATGADRLRIRWMLAGGIAWALSILLQNTPFLGNTASNILAVLLQIAALFTFLYAVLMLRVVDISVVIDRALVYGLITTLVVGIVAAMNSLALRETLTPGAGIALQIIVPLALGILLERVRTYANLFVERVFFRGRFLSEQALKTFAQHAGHIVSAAKLLETTLAQLRAQIGTPAVAIYTPGESGFHRIRSEGDADFPPTLDVDDPALVAARAESKAVDLSGLNSALGADCCVFPMLVLGNLQGVIVCANRPGERYPSAERTLITTVAHAVGAALRMMRARDTEAYLQAMAAGTLSPAESQDKARALLLT